MAVKQTAGRDALGRTRSVRPFYRPYLCTHSFLSLYRERKEPLRPVKKRKRTSKNGSAPYLQTTTKHSGRSLERKKEPADMELSPPRWKRNELASSDAAGADAERSCSRRRSVTDAACPLRVLIGPQTSVLLRSSAERRCAERRDLSGGRDERNGQLMTRVYLKTPDAPGQRAFSRRAASFFLEIRQYSCEKMSCAARKFLAAGHIGSFQIHPKSF